MIHFGIKTISLRFHSQQESKVDPPSPQTGQPHIKADAHTACRLVDWGLWKGLGGVSVAPVSGPDTRPLDPPGTLGGTWVVSAMRGLGTQEPVRF